MRLSPFLFIAGLLLAACTSEPATVPSPPQVPQPTPAPPTPAQTAALAVPQRFLRWYAPRMDSLNSICLVPAACNTDTADVYAVDFKQAEKYLTALARSHYISPTYAVNRRAYYHQWQDTLQAHGMTDGPPEGFNYDPIIYSQDSEELADLLKSKPHLLHYAADSARVGLAYGVYSTEVATSELVFRLSRHGQQWLIDDLKRIYTER